MLHAELQDLIGDVLRRVPEWVRNDMASRDPANRRRAEETLAAMMAAAVKSGTPEALRAID